MPNIKAEPVVGCVGYRVRPMDWLWFAIVPAYSDSTAAFAALVRVVYDDGDEQEFQITANGSGGGVAAGTNQTVPMDRPIRKYGVITNARMVQVSGIVIPSNALYASLAIESSNSGGPLPQRQEICSGYISTIEAPSLGKMESATRYARWAFQGTVAEDATVGTHVCTLTVTPGAGNEMQFLYGRILDGATATSQTASAFIDDGTNVLTQFLNIASTTSAIEWELPPVLVGTQAGNALSLPIVSPFIISGTMRLVLKVSTAAISVTQTFAVVCNIRGLPTATLADTVGTPTLTTNTSKVF